MDNKLEQYKKEIKKKHRFSFWSVPYYQEKIEFNIDSNLFKIISSNVIENLGWKLITEEKDQVTVESSEKWKTHGIIDISLKEESVLTVKSETMFDQRWDNGQNSVRVKLFLKVFTDEYESLVANQKVYCEKYEDRNYKFLDFKYPSKLPPEVNIGDGNIIYPIITGVLTSLFFGIISGYLISEGYFIGFVRELIFGLALWFSITMTAKATDFLRSKVLLRISLFSFVALFFFSEISNYLWSSVIHSQNAFINHWKELFAHFSLKGTASSIFMFIFLLSIIASFYGLFRMSLVRRLDSIINEKIPLEVNQFVEFLVSEGKNERQIREELQRFGWTSKEMQDFLIKEKLIN